MKVPRAGGEPTMLAPVAFYGIAFSFLLPPAPGDLLSFSRVSAGTFQFETLHVWFVAFSVRTEPVQEAVRINSRA